MINDNDKDYIFNGEDEYGERSRERNRRQETDPNRIYGEFEYEPSVDYGHYFGDFG